MDCCDTTSGECLLPSQESEREHNDTFSSNLQDLTDSMIVVFKIGNGYILGNGFIYTYKHLGF